MREQTPSRRSIGQRIKVSHREHGSVSISPSDQHSPFDTCAADTPALGAQRRLSATGLSSRDVRDPFGFVAFFCSGHPSGIMSRWAPIRTT